MKIIQDLVKYSSDLIYEDNYLAHSITIDEYDYGMKKKKI